MVINNVYSLGSVMAVAVVTFVALAMGVVLGLPNLELIIELPARRSSMTFN